MNLVGTRKTRSLSEKKYIFVVMDNYFIYTWVLFITHKSEHIEVFKKLCKRITIEKPTLIVTIRSD